MKTIGEDEVADSGVAMLGRCIAIMEHLKRNSTNNAKVRSLEAQLQELLLEKNEASMAFVQSQGKLKMLESELAWEKAKVEIVEERSRDLEAAHG